VGTALDYRIRYYFRVTPYKKLVATQGAALMLAESSINERVVTNFFEGLSDFVDRVQPARRRLDLRQEKQLARYCLVLALFEQVYRAGVYRILFSNSPLAFASVVVSFRRNFLLDLVSPEWVDDVVAQSYAFYESQSDLCCRRAVLNPTFEGSRDVGGADADLIVNRCLIDIKSTLRPAVSRHLLYQLLGYVLLDYENAYRIREVGVYWSRHRVLRTWPLDELITKLHGEYVSLQTLRVEFQKRLRSASRAKKSSGFKAELVQARQRVMEEFGIIPR